MKLNDVDLNKLRAFLEVAENGSVTAAAVALDRTPSAVSQGLASLERALGTRLFRRVGKRMVPTSAGERLWQATREHHAALRAAMQEVLSRDESPRGVVRIGLFLGFPRARLSALMAGFAQRYPEVSSRLVFAPEADLDRRLQRNRLDFTISFRPPVELMPRVTSTELFEEELVLVSGKKFFRDGFDVAALAEVPIIDYYQSAPLIERWLRHHAPKQRPDYRVAVWAATTDLVVDLVLKNAGVGVVPRYLVDAHLTRRRLKVLRAGRREMTDVIWLNELADTYVDAACRAFRQAAIEELATRDLATKSSGAS